MLSCVDRHSPKRPAFRCCPKRELLHCYRHARMQVTAHEPYREHNCETQSEAHGAHHRRAAGSRRQPPRHGCGPLSVAHRRSRQRCAPPGLRSGAGRRHPGPRHGNPAPKTRRRATKPQILDVCTRLATRSKRLWTRERLPVGARRRCSIAMGTVAGTAAHFRDKEQSIGLIWFGTAT
jgi:hypothetical protein